MSEKKITDTILERIKYFINSIENGEYHITGYEFSIKLHQNGKILTIDDSYFKNSTDITSDASKR